MTITTLDLMTATTHYHYETPSPFQKQDVQTTHSLVNILFILESQHSFNHEPRLYDSHDFHETTRPFTTQHDSHDYDTHDNDNKLEKTY